jgi:integrase
MMPGYAVKGGASPGTFSLTEWAFSRENHDQVLGSLPRPSFLSEGTSLLDDEWSICTGDLAGAMDGIRTIRFDAPVAPGPELLTDRGNLHDLITAKLYVYYGFVDGFATTFETSRRSLNSLLTMIRWRNCQGLRSMSDLTKAWFDLFVDQVTRGGRFGLLPHKERIEAYLDRIRSGHEELPIDTTWKPNLAGSAVARRLGVSSPHQIPAPEWRAILDHLEQVHPLAFRNAISRRENDNTVPSVDESVGNGLTPGAVLQILQPFHQLWRLRDHLSFDPIGVQAFESRATCKTLANSIATKALERTLLPPAYQVCWLVDGALRFVLIYSGHLELIQKIVDEAFRKYPRGSEGGYSQRMAMKRGRASFLRRQLKAPLRALKKAMGVRSAFVPDILPVYQRHKGENTRKSGLAIRDLLFVLLPAACAVVLATFTARRRSELVGLRYDCIMEDEYGDAYLKVWIAKTIRQLDSIPIPQSVCHAINVMVRLSADARAERDEPWIFSLKDPGPEGDVVGFRMNEALNALAEFVGMPALPDGSVWDWKSHQFRVFFGVVYFWHFDFPSLTALSDFYKHFNPTMTRAYITRVIQGALTRLLEEKRSAVDVRKELSVEEGDEFKRAIYNARERSRDFELCRDAFLLEVAHGAISGTDPLSGWGGDAWNRELEALANGMSKSIQFVPGVASERQMTLDEMLRDWISGKQLDPHPGGHGFCKCGSGRHDIAAAACLKAKRSLEGLARDVVLIEADYAYAADETCMGCPHNVQRRAANERYWVARLAEAEEGSQKGATQNLREQAGERAGRIRDHIQRCFGTPRE